MGNPKGTTSDTSTREQAPRDQESTRRIGRFEARAALGLLAVLVGAVPFLALLLLVQRSWAPLASLDGDVADRLNEVVAPSPGLVDALRFLTDFGGNGTAVYVFLLLTAWLWIRNQRRLAAYVATTGVALAVLVPVSKVLVGRARPEVLLPVVEAPSNASFPSGHAMTSFVTYGVLVLVLLPAVRRALRPWLIAAAVLLVVVVGFTRLALGVHFVSDVLAGWALGAGLLAATTAAFRGWLHDQGRPTTPLSEGLDPDAAAVPPAAGPDLPRGRGTLLRLGAAAAAIAVLLTALGLLVTGPLVDTALGRFDTRAVGALLELRTEDRTEIVKGVGALSSTRVVIALTLATAVLAVAVTRRWRPAVFVTVTVAGEALLYFVVAQIVGRSRPEVPDLTAGLPAGASWPSGHAAAAVAVYGSLAALLLLGSHSRWRWVALVVALLLPPVIGLTRVYVAAHRPTDVVAGLLLGTLWLLACVRFLLLDRNRALSR